MNPDDRKPWTRSKWLFAMSALVLISIAILAGEILRVDKDIVRDLIFVLLVLVPTFLGAQGAVDVVANKRVRAIGPAQRSNPPSAPLGPYETTPVHRTPRPSASMER